MRAFFTALVAVAAVASAQGQRPILYVHASSLNLRAEASAEAVVLKTLDIATPCELLASSADWARVRCQGTEGFVKRELLGIAPPHLELLLVQATSGAAADRLNAAMRAGALAPRDVRVRDALRDAFVDAEFAALARLRAEGHTQRKVYSRAGCVDHGDDVVWCVTQTKELMYVFRRGADVLRVYREHCCADFNVEAGSLNEERGRWTFVAERSYRAIPTPALKHALSGTTWGIDDVLPSRAEWDARQRSLKSLVGMPLGWAYLQVDAEGARVDFYCSDIALGPFLSLAKNDDEVLQLGIFTGQDTTMHRIKSVEHPDATHLVLRGEGKLAFTLEYPLPDGPVPGKTGRFGESLVIPVAELQHVRRHQWCNDLMSGETLYDRWLTP